MNRVSNAIYRLKREWGKEVSIFTRGATSADPATGNRSIALAKTTLDRVIVLPPKAAREIVQGIYLASANPRAVRTGGYNATSEVFIVDRKDCPDLAIVQDDWLGYKDTRYEIKNVEEFEELYIIEAEGIPGEAPPSMVYEVSASADMRMVLDADEH